MYLPYLVNLHIHQLGFVEPFFCYHRQMPLRINKLYNKNEKSSIHKVVMLPELVITMLQFYTLYVAVCV